MKVIYYYYYLFYRKVLKDDEPHLLTILALSASEGFFFINIVDFIALKFYCYNFSKWPMFSILVITLLLNALVFYNKERRLKIVNDKPCFFGNQKFSILITVLFFLSTYSSLIWGTMICRDVLENCK